MRTNREHVTMDGNEAKLLDRYEAQFGEAPPIAFLDPQTSKRLMMDAIRNNRPFNEKDLESAQKEYGVTRDFIVKGIHAMVRASPLMTSQAPRSAAR
jgi:hypothetical protein